MTYDWSFGDGRKSSDRVPALSYNVTSTTTFNITLKSTVVGGCSDSLTKSVTVSENPNCAFTATRDWTNGARGMKFTAANTSYASYYYTFGDGGNAAIASPTYKYLYDGTFKVTLTAQNSVGCNCILSKEIAVSSNTGINKLAEGFVKVYPTLTSGLVTLDAGNGVFNNTNVEVLDVQGKVVFTKTLGTLKGISTIDLGNLSSGVYNVHLVSGANSIITKVLIQK